MCLDYTGGVRRWLHLLPEFYMVVIAGIVQPLGPPRPVIRWILGRNQAPHYGDELPPNIKGTHANPPLFLGNYPSLECTHKGVCCRIRIHHHLRSLPAIAGQGWMRAIGHAFG
jgi:hypothetical protein